MTDHLYHHKQQVFTTKAIYRELHRPASSLDNAPVANDHSTTVLFNDLVQLVLGNTQLDSNAIMLQINQSLTLRRQYIRLLKTLAFANSPVQAAASSTMTQISKRNSAEFELLFKPDKQFLGKCTLYLT
ncbi:hypothetical protein RS130_23140 [Paraglaciecola aquimarina]|uniref:Uncharacterized protein n=1 Tax=Paraglaciecola aquimarina TaxID=1235557 RepID=A0ABU3T2E7_9ALTE|nr:hypothetical protein [Paraglaciecola aquimarina]MDU0356402.1 hypothetical protein [Paraglaciecola aquimarina]